MTRGVRSPPLPTDDDDAIPDTRATVGFIVAGPATGEALPTSPRSRRQDRQPLGCVESQTSVTNPAADEGVETQAMPRVLALGLERPAPTPPTQRNSLLQSILTTGPPDDPSASVEPGQNPTIGGSGGDNQVAVLEGTDSTVDLTSKATGEEDGECGDSSEEEEDGSPNASLFGEVGSAQSGDDGDPQDEEDQKPEVLQIPEEHRKDDRAPDKPDGHDLDANPIDWLKARDEARNACREAQEVSGQLQEALLRMESTTTTTAQTLAAMKEVSEETDRRLKEMLTLQTEARMDRKYIAEEGKRLREALRERGNPAHPPDDARTGKPANITSAMMQPAPAKPALGETNGRQDPRQPTPATRPLSTANRGEETPRRAIKPGTVPPRYSTGVPYAVYKDLYEEIAATNRWSAVQKAQYLLGGLTPEAREAVNHIHPEQSGAYQLMTAVLLQRFGDYERVKDYQHALSHRSQYKGETLAAFARDLKELAQRAYPSVDEELRDGVVWRRFLSGLHNRKLADKIHQLDPGSMAQAMAHALAIMKTKSQKSERQMIREDLGISEKTPPTEGGQRVPARPRKAEMERGSGTEPGKPPRQTGSVNAARLGAPRVYGIGIPMEAGNAGRSDQVARPPTGPSSRGRL